MKFKIAGYQVTTDPLNYKVEKEIQKIGDDGQPLQGQFTMRFVGYYPNMERVCEALLEHELKPSDAENLAEIVELIIRSKREIIAAVREWGQTGEKAQTTEEAGVLAD
ncbi:hypothetical protein [Jeotgalibacillus aurantiacus]|uniref:hypothetical protein n=1 Tax=Jeotgalibacillus aurantiacus TaxID=2763266 RepID=UPI001D09CE37|nr:hypothetical protein [Jeotgalibacillus aurantiacus]